VNEKERVVVLVERFLSQGGMKEKDIRVRSETRVDILFAPEVMQDIDAKEHKTTVSPDGMKIQRQKM